MKVGDLIMLSAAGRGIQLNRVIGHKELGIIGKVLCHGGTTLYTVNWMEYSREYGTCPEYYRRELRFAK